MAAAAVNTFVEQGFVQGVGVQLFLFKGKPAMIKLISLALFCAIFLFGANPLFANDHSASTYFVINAPSSASRGPDSILTFNSRGRSAVFFGAEHNLTGLRDIACNPKKPRNILVSHSDANVNASGFLIFNASGRILHTIPSGTPSAGPIALAFDHVGNLYVVENTTVFKNDVSFASLPFTGVGQLAVDSRGNLYLTDPFVSPRLFRIDQAGNVTVFAEAAQGLDSPYGLAIDKKDNIFVANNPGSRPASILKFDPSGKATPFATDISFQPIIRSMTFDEKGNLYATLEDVHTILKFDRAGNSSIFADTSDGLNFPSAITMGTCPVKGKEEEEEKD